MDMSDCDKMMHAAGKGTEKGNCPCCDDKNACPPELCFAKCFKIFSANAPCESAAQFVAVRFQPDKPDRPPDWLDGPQPPPPRA